MRRGAFCKHGLISSKLVLFETANSDQIQIKSSTMPTQNSVVGSYATHSEADKAVKELQRGGIVASVVDRW
jgi:hypothetical protein